MWANASPLRAGRIYSEAPTGFEPMLEPAKGGLEPVGILQTPGIGAKTPTVEGKTPT